MKVSVEDRRGRPEKFHRIIRPRISTRILTSPNFCIRDPIKPEMVASIFSRRIACRQHFRRSTPTKTNEARMSEFGNCSGGTDPERYGAPRLAVRYEPIVALRLDRQNPRLHSHKQLRQIANSIASFGFNVPVLIDAEKSVIAGHGRVLAAKQLGWTEVPVIAIEHLDAAQRRAFAIADNRLTENSIWDDWLGRAAQGAISPRSQFRS